MLTKFWISFYMPETYNADDFKIRLKSTFEKFDIKIGNLQELKSDGLENQAGDLLDYCFETDYDFGLDKWQESEHYDVIMNKMKDIVKYFNERNPEKLRIYLMN